MAETPRLDLPYLSASQAQKEVMHNVSLDRLDLLVQCAVLDRNLTTPPVSPALGDAYIVAATGTGAWAGHENHLALWISSQWQFIAPLPGFTCWVNDESVLIYWSGTGWVIASGGGGSTTFLGLSDTPNSYADQAGKAVLVNPGGTALEFGTSGGGAPVDATYIVSGANATLTAERVLTNSASLAWNTGTAGQVSADIPAGGVTLAQLAPLPFPTLLGRGNPPTGPVEAVSVGTGLTLTGGMLALSSAPGAADFLSLTDTPDSYSDQAGKVVAVNSGATALEFITGGGASYTDEQAQDAVGTILTDSATLDFTYDDTTPSITGIVKDASITEAKLLLADVTTQDASTTAHGLLRKLSGTATQYLDGTGAWSTPAGGGGSGGTPVGATVNRAATFALAANTLTAIPFDTEVVDDAGFWTSGQATRLTFATAGWYSISASINWDASAASRITFIRLNGVATFIAEQSNSGVSDLRQNISTVYKFAAGDYIEIMPYIGSAGSLDYASCSVSTVTSGTVAGATTFLALTDTPDVYAANALKILRVNAAANAVEFGDVLGTMATQNANAVAITGGQAAFTGNLSVAGNTQTNNMGVHQAAAVDRAVNVLHNRAAEHGLVVQPTADSGPGNAVMFLNAGAAAVGSITTTASATSFNTSSDVRLKESIATLLGALDVIRALRPVSFRWQADGSKGVGFLAHELQQVVPEAVSGLPDEVNDDGSIKPQQVDHSKLVPWLTAGLQAALAQIDALTARITTLEEALGA